MPATKTTERTCKNGHRYYKSSTCPVCPICAAKEKPEDELFAVLSAPARRALQNAGITTAEELCNRSKQDLLQLHGFGPSSIPKLEAVLKKQNRALK